MSKLAQIRAHLQSVQAILNTVPLSEQDLTKSEWNQAVRTALNQFKSEDTVVCVIRSIDALHGPVKVDDATRHKVKTLTAELSPHDLRKCLHKALKWKPRSKNKPEAVLGFAIRLLTEKVAEQRGINK